jgi:phage terminase large subunit-like protein
MSARPVPMPRKRSCSRTDGRTSQFSLSGSDRAEAAIRFIESLRIPEGPLAGKKIKLAEFQKRFIRGALADGISIAALSVGRGAGKTMLGAALCLAALLGKIDPQPRREIIVGAKTRDQGRIAWNFVEGLAASLPIRARKQLTFIRAPRLEVRFDGDGGGHVLRVLASDARNALGLAPVFALEDERGFWDPDKGDMLEAAILSALGKRSGRAIVISTSAPTDTHSFSKLLDEGGEGIYVQEHRAPDGCAPDDIAALKIANPGATEGIGSSLEWLLASARRAIARGGSALSSFRLFNLNQRISDDTRSVLIPVDQWLKCETEELPPREGPLVAGIDLGGSSSMSAWANFWPHTGRLECFGAFPSSPSLLDRGQNDAVGDRYKQMFDRGELIVLGANIVPVDQFISAMLAKLEGYPIATICCDRFRQAEFLEALAKTSIRVIPTWRGQGWKDSGEDCERFRQFVFDGRVKAKASLLLRSAFADAVTLVDPTGAAKIAKGRSTGRIDAAAASLLAIAEGARMMARPVVKARAATWA